IQTRDQYLLIISELCFLPASDPHEYIVVEKELSWAEAVNYCRSNHIDLASIENSEENAKNIQLMTLGDNNAHWIGLHTEVIWKWSNGKRLSYTNWKVGEPNQGLMGRCVYLRKGHWEDDTCERPHYFICSAGKILATIPSNDDGLNV
uniref:C-type lectin domain-containing protein n=1 Tax=Gouania willdenowi TaxID=441366 RepID=A0A8C5ENM2_GOUWI